MEIGERIRLFGVQMFGRIKDFAEALEMAPPNLQKYMNNEREPGIGILQKLQRLGCSIDWLISGEGAMQLSSRPQHVQPAIEEPREPEVRVIGSMKDVANINLEKVSLAGLKKRAKAGLKESEHGN